MEPTVFVSRAAADAEFAMEVCRVLEEAGHRVVLQDRDFDNRNFIDAMDEALSSDTRVLALLSPAYLESDYCRAEWQNSIANDPLNRNGRLVLLRIAECRPTGLMAGLAYWDLVPLQNNSPAVADVIRRAVSGAPLALPSHSQASAYPAELTNNLPAQLSSFIGREKVVKEISDRVRVRRLVTVTGTGGVGKTRAALQAAFEMLNEWADGVWFVELAPLVDSAAVCGAVASAVGARTPGDRPVESSLLTFLRNRELLIVLDNCEHLLSESAALADLVLPACPRVRLLATSRERLGIAGEDLYHMPSLAVPADTLVTAEALMQYGAAALLVDRATAVERRFSISDANAPVVAAIVRRLDGIPLAIELAAARMKTLGIGDLARGLDERLSVLTGKSRTAVSRQQTMRALFDWSYDLLSETEKIAFRWLSIFAGGFTLETAATVWSESEVCDAEPIDMLASLVDKSLVHADFAQEKTRYRLLESTREYAGERLSECGERERTARAHANAYLALAEVLNAAWSTTPESIWSQEVKPELDNWRLALEWALAKRNAVDLGQRLFAALQRGELPITDRLRWLKVAQRGIDETTPGSVVAHLHLCDARLAATLFQYKASLPAAKKALDAFRALGDRDGTAEAERYVGSALTHLGNVTRGEKSLRKALNLYRELQAEREVGRVLQDLGDSRNLAGDIENARSFYAEALDLFKASASEERSASVARNLAELEFRCGNVETSLDLVSDVLVSDRQKRDRVALANDLLNISAYLIVQGSFQDAATCSREAYSLARAEGTEVFAVVALQHVAAAIGLSPSEYADKTREARRRAARVLGYVDARLSALSCTRQYTEQQEYDSVFSAIGQSLDQDEVGALREEGRRFSANQAAVEAFGRDNPAACA